MVHQIVANPAIIARVCVGHRSPPTPKGDFKEFTPTARPRNYSTNVLQLLEDCIAISGTAVAGTNRGWSCLVKREQIPLFINMIITMMMLLMITNGPVGGPLANR